MGVSVVVPVKKIGNYSSAVRLSRNSEQALPPDSELVLVFSTKEARDFFEIAHSVLFGDVSVRAVLSEKKSPSGLYDEGIRASSNRSVVLTHEDVEFGGIESLVESLEEGDAAVVVPFINDAWSEQRLRIPASADRESVARDVYSSLKKRSVPYFFSTSAAIDRDAYSELGGFSPYLRNDFFTAEFSDRLRNAGKKIYLAPSYFRRLGKGERSASFLGTAFYDLQNISGARDFLAYLAESPANALLHVTYMLYWLGRKTPAERVAHEKGLA